MSTFAQKSGEREQPTQELLDQWLEQAREGVQAFEHLYDYYFPRIYNYIVYRVGDRSRAEDMTADVFVRVIDKFASFSGDSQAFTAWIYRIAGNLLTDYYRKADRKVQVHFLEPEKLSFVASSHDVQQEVTDNLDRRETVELVRKAIGKLKPVDQEIIALKFFEELDNATIASIVSMKVGTVTVRLHRALEKLRSLCSSSVPGGAVL